MTRIAHTATKFRLEPMITQSRYGLTNQSFVDVWVVIAKKGPSLSSTSPSLSLSKCKSHSPTCTLPATLSVSMLEDTSVEQYLLWRERAIRCCHTKKHFFFENRVLSCKETKELELGLRAQNRNSPNENLKQSYLIKTSTFCFTLKRKLLFSAKKGGQSEI